MASVEAVVATINYIGNGATYCVTTLLNLNHLVVSKAVLFVSFLLSCTRSWLELLTEAVRIVLEDLILFLQETGEGTLRICNAVFDVFDGVFDRIVWAATGADAFVRAGCGGVTDAAIQTYLSLCACMASVKNFVCLVGSTVILMVKLIPTTLYMLVSSSGTLVLRAAFSIKAMLKNSLEVATTAPLENFVGLGAILLIGFSAFKLTSKIVREHRVTPSLVARNFFRGLVTVQISMIRLVLLCFGLGLRVVSAILTHLHVPRFHHAGDSDDEGDSDDDEDVSFGTYDSSDNEERARQEAKRQRYELLLRRRQHRSAPHGNDFEMLFDQMERDREEKLCVICQDKEKCIMMLPCRHLCVCQGCRELWRSQASQGKKCPMCRKHVRQTIKAYL